MTPLNVTLVPRYVGVSLSTCFFVADPSQRSGCDFPLLASCVCAEPPHDVTLEERVVRPYGVLLRMHIRRLRCTRSVFPDWVDGHGDHVPIDSPGSGETSCECNSAPKSFGAPRFESCQCPFYTTKAKQIKCATQRTEQSHRLGIQRFMLRNENGIPTIFLCVF